MSHRTDDFALHDMKVHVRVCLRLQGERERKNNCTHMSNPGPGTFSVTGHASHMVLLHTVQQLSLATKELQPINEGTFERGTQEKEGGREEKGRRKEEQETKRDKCGQCNRSSGKRQREANQALPASWSCQSKWASRTSMCMWGDN